MTILAYRAEDIIFPRRLSAWKRAMDVIGAAAGILLSLPMCAVVALYIACVSPGPVFYKSKRVGYNGKLFTMWKFRTMTCGDVSAHRSRMKALICGDRRDAAMTKLDDDPRLIALAGFLRKTCIDEVPQFINVLRGEMSLVGPRPALPYEEAEFSAWHYARENVVPGMTGLWQVSGKNRLSFREMVALDIRYSREMSLWLDVRILLLTLPAILRQLLDHIEAKRSKRGTPIRLSEQ